MPKILFLGDIVGRPGRDAVTSMLPGLRAEQGYDLVVANGENAASGAGINARIARQISEAGVDAITLGDHVWDQRGFEDEIGGIANLCRPANLPAQCPGHDHLLITTKDGFRLGIVTVLGRTFMKTQADDPFACADRYITMLADIADGVLVEIHAEATSEKIAMGWYMDGRASIVVGTHTHVPTADGRLLERGTAYLTDAGMSGPYRSVLGREVQPVVARFLDGMPRKFHVANDDVRLSGFEVELDDKGIATSAQYRSWQFRP